MTTVTTPSPGNGQNSQTTTTVYNNRLWVTSVVAPDGGTTTNEYLATGELKRTYGARTYPVGYSYDYAGRLKTMTNWTSFNLAAGTRVTTWNYDTNRGWLNNKRYDNSQGPDYTYTAGGRLRTRSWARIGTSSTRISTTYTYGFNGGTANNVHGDLIGITYANDPQSTPSVTNTYDRRGRTATVLRNGITTTFAYNFASQLLSQTNSGGTLNSWWVANGYDSLLRRTNFQVKAGGTLNASFSYGYDNASRLQSVTDGTNNASYAYLANSPLVSQITLKSNATSRMTVSKSYDYLNRLTQISSAPSGASPLTFNYTYNAANQRIQVTLADGSFWLYEYDSLGQVTSGKKYWADWTPVAGQQFEYTHDDIGNRSQTKAGGDQNGSGLRVASYSVNNLNQYTNRTVPGAVDVLGIANAAATVTVNGQSTYRKVEYYWNQLSITNTSAPQWQGVTNKAVQGSTTNTVTGNVFLPKTPEIFFYDADGNLLCDGRWTNTWDAENRLIAMQGLSTLPQSANLLLNFEYDWQGRRIRKQVSTWNGHKYSLSTDLKAFYDGWNCVVESNGSDAVQRRYMWGLDLSGSLQGAGGVGGLLMVQDVSGGTGAHFAEYDGNGNVAGLAKATDGTFSATYEYGPFGEVVRASGSMAKVNPIRFSAKYQDDETDLLYYGYRYYSPSTGRWLSRDPLEEEGGIALYAASDNDLVNSLDYLGMKGSGHHIIPWSIFNGAVKDEVQKFFDSDLARIFNEYYKSHGAERLDGISAKQYNKLVNEELEKFLGGTALKDMTLKQAEEFLNLIKNAPPSSGIAVYNNAVRRNAETAMKRALEKAAEQAAEKSLERVIAAGAKKGGPKLAKAIPLVGTVVAIYFIYDDSKVYGAGPAIINGAVDAIPLVGTGKILGELIDGQRFLDVTVGPKTVKPSETSCGGSNESP